MEEYFVRFDKAVMNETRLTATARLVYANIIGRIGNNESSWPSTRLIAKELGFSQRTVVTGIQQLEKFGLLVVDHGNSHKSNNYRPTSVIRLYKSMENGELKFNSRELTVYSESDSGNEITSH